MSEYRLDENGLQIPHITRLGEIPPANHVAVRAGAGGHLEVVSDDGTYYPLAFGAHGWQRITAGSTGALGVTQIDIPLSSSYRLLRIELYLTVIDTGNREIRVRFDDISTSNYSNTSATNASATNSSGAISINGVAYTPDGNGGNQSSEVLVTLYVWNHHNTDYNTALYGFSPRAIGSHRFVHGAYISDPIIANSELNVYESGGRTFGDNTRYTVWAYEPSEA
jgi:hypothetical protein